MSTIPLLNVRNLVRAVISSVLVWLPGPGFGPASAHAAAVHYVSPDGRPNNAGTVESPWDIDSALSGKQAISPGATIFLKAGTYRHPDRSWQSQGFAIAVAGAPGSPIHIRPVEGARVTIDGRVEVKPNSRYIWVWNLELTISETADWNRKVTAGGLNPDGPASLPQGGLNILGGSESKFINLVIHDMNSGVGFWRGATNAEMHGCLIYGIGAIGPDRYHGPGIYTQNETGAKWITDNILFGNYSTTIQAYGSKNAPVDGFRLIGNITFAPVKAGDRARILVGGGRPSRDILVRENLLYEVPLEVGYTAPYNEDAVVQTNWVVNAGMSINNFRQVTQQGNLVLGPQQPRPDRIADVFLRPNKYDPRRAHLAIYNWQRNPTVPVDLKAFLRVGDSYDILNALDCFGRPVASGTYDGSPVQVAIPAEERTGNGEFCAYVVFARPRSR